MKNIIYSPWIPDEKVTDFNVSFWAGLMSNLITGIVTGLIVGIVIWLMQKRHQDRQTQKECEREVSIFLQTVKASIGSSPEDIVSEMGERNLPSNLLKTIELIAKSPIDYWLNNLNEKYLIEVSCFREIFNLNLNFVKTSSHLDDLIANRLLDHFNMINYPYFVAPFYGLINRYSIDFIRKWHPHSDMLREERMDLLSGFLEESSFKDLIQQYMLERNLLLEKFSELEKIFDTKEKAL